MARPTFKLYSSNGVTLIYNFEFTIDDASGSPFFTPMTFIEHSSLRGQGSIISEGSLQPYDIQLTFLLQGSGDSAEDKYEDLAAQMDSLYSTIVFNTKYILKVEKVLGGATKDIKCKRLLDFSFPLDRKKKRTSIQTVVCILRANTWA